MRKSCLDASLLLSMFPRYSQTSHDCKLALNSPLGDFAALRGNDIGNVLAVLGDTIENDMSLLCVSNAGFGRS
eukprot:5366887-Amphidinium_carterae.3